jgi:hypothetical protein
MVVFETDAKKTAYVVIALILLFLFMYWYVTYFAAGMG